MNAAGRRRRAGFGRPQQVGDDPFALGVEFPDGGLVEHVVVLSAKDLVFEL